jgi:transcriptional regulator with XRE-family HTH domain
MSSGPRRAGGLGVFLKTIRRKGRYSRRELAEASDLSPATIRDYEAGKRSPGFEAICRLSIALQVPVRAFAQYIDTSKAFRLQKKRPDEKPRLVRPVTFSSLPMRSAVFWGKSFPPEAAPFIFAPWPTVFSSL